MSLIKQLWISVIVIMVLSFLSSFIISTTISKSYFEEQLQLKNMDNASSLAIMLSNVDKNETIIDLMISAQFDTGHYRSIEFISVNNDMIEKKSDDDLGFGEVPSWFANWVSINPSTSSAHVQDGWNQYGTIYVQSEHSYAYESLWKSTVSLFYWSMGITLIVGIIGTIILQIITQPLEDVVYQAEQIASKRFMVSDEPRTKEFKKVVNAMNMLSMRIKSILDVESKRIEDLRVRIQNDATTGFHNRDYFMDKLDTYLSEAEVNESHSMILIRVQHLNEINQKIGRLRTDELLKKIANIIRSAMDTYPDLYTGAHYGRLNGSDFAIIMSNAQDFMKISLLLKDKFSHLSEETELDTALSIVHAACYFRAGEKRGSLMMHLDSLLAIAEHHGHCSCEISTTPRIKVKYENADEWRKAISKAITEGNIQGEKYPVRRINGDLLHEEVMMRMVFDGELKTAGYFIPWAKRLNLLPNLDIAMLHIVINMIKETGGNIAYNLSMETLSDLKSRNEILKTIRRETDIASRLFIEIAECSVLKNPTVFSDFCAQVNDLGCHVGIERAETGFTQIENLHEIGIDYIKISPVLIHDISINPDSQDLLKSVSGLCRSMGIDVIADGVVFDQEKKLLEHLGVDAISGPGVDRESSRRRDKG